MEVSGSGGGGEKKRRSTNAAPVSAKLRSHFRIVRKLEPIFSGNQVGVSPDGHYILCDCGESGVKIVDTTDSSVVGVLRQEEEAFTCFCTLPIENEEDENNKPFYVVTGSHNGLLRQWRVIVCCEEEQGENPLSANITLIRSWKAQPAIPAGRLCSLEMDASNTLLASGFTDGSVRIWDLQKKTCTHMLRGHVGVVSLIRFFSKDGRHVLLTSAAGDGQLRAWDLNSGSNPTFTQLNGHSSVVTDAIWSSNGNRLVTVSRDQLIVVWDAAAFEKLRAWPCFEQIESVFLCPIIKKVAQKKDDEFQVITAGARGQVRIWDIQTGKCLVQSTPIAGNDITEKMEVENQPSSQHVGFLTAIKLGGNSLLCSTSDHRLIFYEFVEDVSNLTFEEKKQIPGDVGEVLDISCIKMNQEVENLQNGLLFAVATNSPLIRIYDSANWSCVFLAGHRAVVTSLATTLRGGVSYLVSGSRDNDALVWQVSRTGDGGKVKANIVARAAGHTGAILSVATISNGGEYFVSAGVDLTIKLWPLSSLSGFQSLSCLATVKAHDKDINSLALSPNGRYLASGSQDKTSKIWMIESDQAGVAGLQMLGILRGHHRAIWSLEFSPIDQIVATASADGTLKIWALSNLSCLKTFEGHDVAVLRCRFMNRGTQLVSGGADGNVKTWAIQTGECVSTLETGHDDKAWAVTPVADGKWLATGSSDDRLVIWHDYTQEYVGEVTKRDHARALDAQRLDNLLAGRNFVDAFCLALSLNQPARLWRIVRELRVSLNDQTQVPKIVANLDNASLASLIRIICAWNTNTRFVLEAQFMLNTVLQVRPIDDLLAMVKNDLPSTGQQLLRDAVEALIAYTQRHFARVDRLATQSAFTDFAWSQLKLMEEPSS